MSPREKKVIAPAVASDRVEPATRDPVTWFREDCTAEERQRLRTKCKRAYKDVHAACWKGDLDAVRYFLAEDPDAAVSKDFCAVFQELSALSPGQSGGDGDGLH